jgi:glycosyltransferase involved in cell wall biosynthesis
MTQLARALRARRPDVIQGWMYHANIAATLTRAWTRLDAPVLWNIRASLMERRHEKWRTLLLIRLGGKLSFSPARIINNSAASALEHEREMGYRAAKRVVLPNGFDTDRFRPSPTARAAVRASLGLADSTLLIGCIGRYHPMKDHRAFLRAAALVAQARGDVSFVLAGKGVEPANAELADLIAEHALDDRVHLLGPRSDIAEITASLDISVSSSSSGEGFPNVIGEAMSCAVPCVVTDVGDSAAVVGDAGITVPPRDCQALAQAVLRLIDLGGTGRAALGLRARQRAIERFSLDAVVRQYEDLYTQVHQEQRSGR